MNKEYNLTLTLAVTVMLIVGCGYVRSVRHQFAQNNSIFEQVGVMEYRDNGNTVYIPVFKRK